MYKTCLKVKYRQQLNTNIHDNKTSDIYKNNRKKKQQVKS